MVKYDLLKTYRITAISSRIPADGFVVTAHGETRKTATKKGAELMSRHGRGLRDKSRCGSIAQRLEQRTAFQLGKRMRRECNQRQRDNEGAQCTPKTIPNHLVRAGTIDQHDLDLHHDYNRHSNPATKTCTAETSTQPKLKLCGGRALLR